MLLHIICSILAIINLVVSIEEWGSDGGLYNLGLIYGASLLFVVGCILHDIIKPYIDHHTKNLIMILRYKVRKRKNLITVLIGVQTILGIVGLTSKPNC